MCSVNHQECAPMLLVKELLAGRVSAGAMVGHTAASSRWPLRPGSAPWGQELSSTGHLGSLSRRLVCGLQQQGRGTGWMERGSRGGSGFVCCAICASPARAACNCATETATPRLGRPRSVALQMAPRRRSALEGLQQLVASRVPHAPPNPQLAPPSRGSCTGVQGGQNGALTCQARGSTWALARRP